jgi:hypothetical protein
METVFIKTAAVFFVAALDILLFGHSGEKVKPEPIDNSLRLQ